MNKQFSWTITQKGVWNKILIQSLKLINGPPDRAPFPSFLIFDIEKKHKKGAITLQGYNWYSLTNT